MTTQSVIEHRSNMYYVEFREDYLAISLACSYKKPVNGSQKSKATPYCKSLILSISESWTNNKRGNGDLSFYMTYSQWEESMYGMYGRNVIIDSVAELVGEGLLSREAVRYNGKETFRYLFNYTEINTRLKMLDARDPDVTSPLVNGTTTGLKVNGFKSKRVTGLKVNDHPFTSNHNIESTQHHYTESRDTNRDALVSVAPPVLACSQQNTTNGHTSIELSTQPTKIVDNSKPEPVATSNPIANDTDQPTKQNKVQTAPPTEKKPRKPVALDDTTKARVERVFTYFDGLKQEVTGDPEAKYIRTKQAISDIKEKLLPCNPTEQRLRKVYMALWDTPRDARSGFEWKKNMTIKAVCGQYESRVIDIIAEEQREAQKKRVKETFVPPTPAKPEEDLPFNLERFRGKSRRGPRQAAV